MVADNREEIAEEVRRFSVAYDYILTTGGIGPTHDDVTIEGAAPHYIKYILFPCFIKNSYESIPGVANVYCLSLKVHFHIMQEIFSFFLFKLLRSTYIFSLHILHHLVVVVVVVVVVVLQLWVWPLERSVSLTPRYCSSSLAAMEEEEEERVMKMTMTKKREETRLWRKWLW